LIEEKAFREDLYYRLNVLPVEMPPLRERPDDIPLLVHHFLDRARADHDCRVEGLTDEALERIVAHDWPGNVRELENLMERLLVLNTEGEIGLENLPPEIHAGARTSTQASTQVPASGLDFNQVVEQLEVDLILQALEHTHWNKNRAAQLLGLNRTTLEGKIRKRGLAPPGQDES
jgi:DNA-binding NtrC family response regulator